MKPVLALFVVVGSLVASIDVNHASVKELVKLKGIGDSKAVRIVEYIKKNGCFKNASELTKVKGIGESILAKNKVDIKIVPCKK